MSSWSLSSLHLPYFRPRETGLEALQALLQASLWSHRPEPRTVLDPRSHPRITAQTVHRHHERPGEDSTGQERSTLLLLGSSPLLCLLSSSAANQQDPRASQEDTPGLRPPLLASPQNNWILQGCIFGPYLFDIFTPILAETEFIMNGVKIINHLRDHVLLANINNENIFLTHISLSIFSKILVNY